MSQAEASVPRIRQLGSGSTKRDVFPLENIQVGDSDIEVPWATSITLAETPGLDLDGSIGTDTIAKADSDPRIQNVGQDSEAGKNTDSTARTVSGAC